MGLNKYEHFCLVWKSRRNGITVSFNNKKKKNYHKINLMFVAPSQLLEEN